MEAVLDAQRDRDRRADPPGFPPAVPVAASGDWQEVESNLGLALPADFNQLIETYGLGQFVDFITPLTPFGPHDLLMRSARRILDSERDFRSRNPDMSPYALYPEPGGLLEYAGTGNGDRLCWLTEGDPDQWTTVAWNQRSWRHDTYPVGAVEFLHGWLAGRITTSVFGSRGHGEPEPWFEPFRRLKHWTVKLSDSDIPYAERLRILQDTLAPTASRGGWSRQEHFAATSHGWRLTYETGHAHQILIAFPSGDEDLIRSVLPDMAHRMGCQVVATTARPERPSRS